MAYGSYYAFAEVQGLGPPKNIADFFKRRLSKIMDHITIAFCCAMLLSNLIISSVAVDTIRANQSIRDGDTIVSARGEFELGFFSAGSSTKRYLGIWYKKISYGTVVWVANRETPLNSSSGAAIVNSKGIIMLTTGGESGDKIIWSSNLTTRHVTNPIAQLLDTGNLVIREENKEDFLWQSFDYPFNIMLPGMRLGVNLLTGFERYYTSWKNIDDPSPGRYMLRLDPTGFPQIFAWKDSLLWSRVGAWTGTHFSGHPNHEPDGIYTDGFILNKEEISFGIDLVNNISTSAIARVVLNPEGIAQVLIWNNQNQNWMVYLTIMIDDCDNYGSCGENAICNRNNSPRCECMRGFVPQFPDKWKSVDWSNGCVRKKILNCNTKELGFVKYAGVTLPDTRYSWYDMRINLEECRRLCLKNCSCTAYANLDIRRGGNGCLLWFNHLIDIRGYTNDGQVIYVKVPASELEAGVTVYKQVWFITTFVIFVVLTVLLALIFMQVFRKRKLNREERLKFSSEAVALNKIETGDLELPLFEFIVIVKATDNFSHINKLGEGGFGPVYKGILADGQEIAVKRLSHNSSQGLDEFKNEVSCIAKLQHRNLVALLGCCIEREERILIYEYMPNKSLDSFIFDEEASKSMGWSRRSNIINGIARGLLYLHQDSKLRIIHRDLKASNILLDHDMNPKISDFGMARSFRGTQTEANTKRVVGTYGYMSPEYVIDGLFSIKSDVYSFGVLLIEMVSGKKNRLFTHPDHSLNLLGHAWIRYNEDRLLDLVDGVIMKSSNNIEVFRVIQIGLLCVQQYPEDRPSMAQVVLMLTSKIQLPHPKQPGFFEERRQHNANDSSSSSILISSNEFTLTSVSPRE